MNARIAIVTANGQPNGGGERLLALYLEEQARRACPTSVLFLQDGALASDARALGHDVAVVEKGRLRNPVAYARTVRALRRWLQARRPAAVVSWDGTAQFFVGPAASGLHVPRFWYQQAPPSRHWHPILANIVPCEGVIACSSYVRAAQLRQLPHRPVAVVHPGIEAAATGQARGGARTALGIPPRALVVLLVSRLERWKGVHVAIEAAAEVLARFPDAVFVHAGGRQLGDHGYAETLWAQGSGLGDHWRFLGHVPPEALATWYRAADVFVHPNDPNVGTEGFGMAVVEAMAAGLPVVVSALGGPVEIVTQGVDGILVPPGDAAALARAVSELLGDPAARARLGSAARIRAAAFSADTYPDRLRDALTSLVPSLSGGGGTLAGNEPHPDGAR